MIAIGDELLIGQVTDTNSGEIARMIQPVGWELRAVHVVHDSADEIRKAIDRAMAESEVVLTTGGLGPTKDDITKKVLCDYFGGELRYDNSVLENILTVFEKRGLTINKLTEEQALVPTSCRVIQNRVGTAPIMWFEREGKVLVSMPGVPFEMREMMRSEVLPQLLAHFGSDVSIGHRTVIITDMTESAVAMALDDWEENLPAGIHLAYLPQPGLIRLRLDGQSTDKQLLDNELDRLTNELRERFGENVLCTEDMKPEEVVLQRLRKHNYTMATAESCTGGNIAHRITMIAGCSDVYLGSVVSYANEVKTGLLGVAAEVIERYGAVSEEVARLMAEGATRATGADCSVATSGIAGPGGGVEGKPVGTVCIAWHTPEGTWSETFHFPGSRDRVIDRASTTALLRLAQKL